MRLLLPPLLLLPLLLLLTAIYRAGRPGRLQPLRTAS